METPFIRSYPSLPEKLKTELIVSHSTFARLGRSNVDYFLFLARMWWKYTEVKLYVITDTECRCVAGKI